MRRICAALVASLAIGLAPAAPAHAAPTDPRLAGVQDWAFGLGMDADDPAVLDSLSRYDLVVGDGGQTSSASVARLQRPGAMGLGNLSVATMEPFRSWYRKIKPFGLPDR